MRDGGGQMENKKIFSEGVGGRVYNKRKHDSQTGIKKCNVNGTVQLNAISNIYSPVT